MKRLAHGHCQLCNRLTGLSFHHLIPRKLHRRTRFRKQYSREALNEGVNLCRLCHRGLHRLFDEMTLGRDLATLEQLRAHPTVARHVAWVAKQKCWQ